MPKARNRVPRSKLVALHKYDGKQLTPHEVLTERVQLAADMIGMILGDGPKLPHPTQRRLQAIQKDLAHVRDEVRFLL